MDMTLFNKLMKEWRGLLVQREEEWRQFLEIACAYFSNHNILHPTVVEIGIGHGAQKAFYQLLMGALHIGIDNVNTAADIFADSNNFSTALLLEKSLAGSVVDLLFIDGAHDYAAVRCDYRLYASRTRHIIALHDIFLDHLPEGGSAGIGRLWSEIVENEPQHTFLTIKKRTMEADPWGGPWQMGIGMIIKRQEAA